MTISQFDQIIGYLIEVMLPPNVSDDPTPSLVQVLDVLEKHCEVVRGIIMRAEREQ